MKLIATLIATIYSTFILAQEFDNISNSQLDFTGRYINENDTIDSYIDIFYDGQKWIVQYNSKINDKTSIVNLWKPIIYQDSIRDGNWKGKFSKVNDSYILHLKKKSIPFLGDKLLIDSKFKQVHKTFAEIYSSKLGHYNYRFSSVEKLNTLSTKKLQDIKDEILSHYNNINTDFFRPLNFTQINTVLLIDSIQDSRFKKCNNDYFAIYKHLISSIKNEDNIHQLSNRFHRDTLSSFNEGLTFYYPVIGDLFLHSELLKWEKAKNFISDSIPINLVFSNNKKGIFADIIEEHLDLEISKKRVQILNKLLLTNNFKLLSQNIIDSSNRFPPGICKFYSYENNNFVRIGEYEDGLITFTMFYIPEE